MIRLLRAGCLLEAGAKKPKAASMAEEEGVAEKAAVKPVVARDTGKLTRCGIEVVGVLTHPVRATALSAGMSAPAIAAAP